MGCRLLGLGLAPLLPDKSHSSLAFEREFIGRFRVQSVPPKCWFQVVCHEDPTTFEW